MRVRAALLRAVQMHPSSPNDDIRTLARWRELRAHFEALVELAPAERVHALERRALDASMRVALERMLAADALEQLAADNARAPRGDSAAPERGSSRPNPGELGSNGVDARERRVLGRYELLERLGAGGMGEVHLALDRALDRRVALKLLSPRYTADPRWLARFQREARAASAVNHPNILTIHEIGESDGTHFIATEHIDGVTLRARLERGALPPQEALDIAIQIAGALGAAHAAGIVHRDIKPENVMLRGDGLVKVLDFGLARATASDSAAHEHDAARPITTPGLVIGTLAYMAPEQARGLQADARSDVFALGVVLYELLTGRVPFNGASPIDLIVAILQHTPERLPASIERALPGITQSLERALAKAPDARHADALRWRDELRALRAGSVGIELGASSNVRASAITPAATTPPIRYAKSGDVNIAYQVLGDAAIDLVFVMGWVSHLEYFWSEPSFARFLRRLSQFARVILFDKRGTGLSDRVPNDQLPTLEQRMDDVRAVMDAVGSRRAVLCGVSEGGPMCTLFAATYPEKTIALVMIGSYARRLRDVDYPWGPTAAERDLFLEEIRASWGGPVGIATRAPSRADDAHFREWWAAYLRHGASPSAAVALTRMNAEIDIRKVLPSVRVPTLVVHRSGDQCLVVEEGRYLAERIPSARYVELGGVDHLPFVGDQDEILDAVEEFLTGMTPATKFERVLATVLVARAELDAHGARGPTSTSTSTSASASANASANPNAAAPARDANAAHERATREWHERLAALAAIELRHFHGQPAPSAPGLVRATFDGPARAIRAACAISDAAKRAGIATRIGLHTGECDVIGAVLGGCAVAIAERVAERAQPGAILVSSTVRDLVAGAGIRFAPRGVERFDADGEHGGGERGDVERGDAFGADVGELRLYAVDRVTLA